jgi:hypothetical protein
MQIKKPTHQEIAARAYELYLQRGRINGYDQDDWLQAEYELLQLPVEQLAELDPPARPKDKTQPRSLVEVVRAAMVF